MDDAGVPPLIEGAEERYARVRGVRVRYLFRAQSTSPHADPPIILLHGLLGFSYSWRHNIAPLSEIAPVYAPDLPGVGYSERPAEFDCSLAGQAEFLFAFLSEVGVEQFDLIASSHGGGIAIIAAARDIAEHGLDGRRIRLLVLAAPVNPWSAGRPWLTAVASSRLGWQFLRGAYPLVLRANVASLRRLYGDPARMEADAARNYALAAMVPQTREHIGSVMRSWPSDIRGLPGALTAIREVPTLLVWGSRDRAVLPSSAEPLAKCFDQVEVKIIEGAGHLPYEETPEEFNAAVKKFLRSRLKA
jgi:pimeloyl-ACP methyl ester carboxylesterase